jgi:hypothetical protein
LEISRISLDEASINLVRNPQHEWNLTTILERPGVGPVQPKSSVVRAPERSRLPYIEVSNTRINVKRGVEKLPFSLTDSDASLWMEQPGEWGFRLHSRPMRTDVPVVSGDTGEIRVEGTLGDGKTSTADLHELPFKLKGSWSGAQFGQLTRILLGRDAGWRGDLAAEADLEGNSSAIKIHTRMRAQQIRRDEIEQENSLDFDAVCDAIYQRDAHLVDDIHCSTPIGKGQVRLEGTYPLALIQSQNISQPAVTLRVVAVPVKAPLDLLRTLRPEFAPEIQAEGRLDGELHFGRAEGTAVSTLTGELLAKDVSLTGGGLTKPLVLPTMSFHAPQKKAVPAKRSLNRSKGAGAIAASLLLDPVDLEIGGSSPLKMGMLLDSSGYLLTLAGSGPLDTLLQDAQSLGVEPADLALKGGFADLDLSVAGPWIRQPESSYAGRNPDGMSGRLRLRKAQFAPKFLAGPVDVDEMSGTLTDDGTDWQWSAGAVHFAGFSPKGSLHVPSICEDSHCKVEFSLDFASLEIGALQKALLGAAKKETVLSDLLDRLSSAPAPVAWPAMQGKVHVASLLMERTSVRNLSAEMSIEGRGLKLGRIEGELAGGKLSGEVEMESGSGKPARPDYSMALHLANARAAEVARLIGSGLDSALPTDGTVNLDTTLHMTGFTAAELTGTASGDANWEWKNKGELASGKLTVSESSIVRGSIHAGVSGAVTLWPKFNNELKIH